MKNIAVAMQNGGDQYMEQRLVIVYNYQEITDLFQCYGLCQVTMLI